jgi:DNA-directed RNA polymerase beta' subunit
MPFLPSTSETETIVGIQFGIFSPDEIIRRSVVEITNHNTQEGKIGGLFDPRMGVLENGKNCRSCFQNNHKCQGHWGYYKLARPVYYIQFFKLVLKVLRCCCMKCGRILVDKEKHSNLLKLKGEARWKQVLLACQKISRCGEETVDGCGARQPRNYTEEDICKIFAEWKDMEIPADTELPEGAKVTGESRDADGTKVVTRFVTLRKFLEPEYVHRLLKRISDEDVDFMGFSRYWCRPDWMMCTVLAIPPPQVRPSVLQDNNQRSEDDLTQKLVDIIKTNSLLTDKIAKNVKKKVIDEWTNVLQYHIATFINNEIPGVAPSAQRSGRPLKSVQQRLGSKEGRIRNNLQGKRVEHSARTVITPDPNLSIKEIGVPIKIASNLTYPERVTAFNINKLYRLIQNGPDVYPGAKTIVRSADNRMISLKHVTGKVLQLFEGDIVNRHLMDGDYVLFNRQPSLHRMSMMGHQVRVLPYNTFRLNVSVTAPYNADFDGDEMNLHAPQSEEAAMELREIAAVPLQIVSPRDSKPIVSVVQDTLVGVNRFMRNNVRLTMREAMNMLIHSSHWSGFLPEAIEADKGAKWTGQQIVSVLLPPLNLQMPNGQFDDERDKDKEGRIKPDSQNFVRINNGVIEQGVFDKSVFSSQLIHLIYNDYGPQRTVEFLDSLQRIIANHLINSGFSVGLSDLIADDNTRKEIDRLMGDLKVKIENIIQQVHLGLFDNSSGRSNQEEFERLIFGELNQVVNTAGKLGRNSLADNNRMTNMIKAGSKGSNTNVAQMIAVLGQQNVEGKRIPYGLQDRTLPHFKRYDDGAAARGFIESSFIKGLTPSETFFHAMSGREGLIDTAVKTADTGYLQRQLVKAMEDLMIQHDKTVRDAAGTIIQFSYGEDGTNSTKIEYQQLNIGGLSDEQIQQRFAVPDAGGNESEEFIQQVIEDRKMLVEGVFSSKLVNTEKQSVAGPVHLDRTIRNIVLQFNLNSDEPNKVTGPQVLATINKILERTMPTNKIWAALLRYHMNPQSLQRKGFTQASLEILAVQIINRNWSAWCLPGEMVGIIAAQSIGEPSTQMTLNSVDWDTKIMIAKDGHIISTMIGEFIDNYYESLLETEEGMARIQYLPNGQIYIPLNTEHDWKAVSCDEDGKIQWTRLEAITRHPVVNDDGTDTILEVQLESGRTIKATKAKSFLKLTDGKIVAANGSDLVVGDELPIAKSLAIDTLPSVKSWSLRSVLPATDYLYGTEVEKACDVMIIADGVGARHWFSHNNGKAFTVPYKRNDSFREAFANGHNKTADQIKRGFVYPKHTAGTVSQIPEEIQLDRAFGYFCGAYLAEGMANTTQISITNNNLNYLAPIKALMASWNVETHITCEERVSNIGIAGTSTSLVIHSTLLAKAIQTVFGRVSYEKKMPDWVLQASDEFINGLVDSYICGDGSVSKDTGVITATSVCKELLVKMQAVLTRYGIFSTMSSCMPNLDNFKSVQRYYTMYIPEKYASVFHDRFTLSLDVKQERLDDIRCKRSEFADVVLDRIKSIKEIRPMGDGWVYDLTVETTRNFMTEDLVLLRDTFHLAGVASKSAVTRGIPRLKELLKATKNPKASSLNICLRPEIRKNKEDARRVSQELEFTLLQDIVKVARIYFDPRDDKTIITQDQEWLSFFLAYEGLDQTETQGEEEAVETVVDKKSPWIMRLELDRDKMFMKNITMEDVMYVVNRRFGSSIVTSYTDYNADELVVRIRMEQAADPMDDLITLKKLQNNLLTNTLIRGVTGLKSVTFSLTKDYYYEMVNGKYEKVEQFVLDTDGTNFLDVMCHPDIDSAKLYSNNIHDIYANLGVEATRAVLLREISGLFEDNNVNYRHFGLLCDVICSKGKLMTVDRYGINKNNIGPLAKASFEQTEDIMLRAALFGELDPVTGVSANIMTGQPIRGGTSYSSILLDEDALRKFMSESTGVSMPVETEQEFTEADEDDILYAKRTRAAKDDPCALPRLRLEASIPEQKEVDAQYSEMEITLVNE